MGTVEGGSVHAEWEGGDRAARDIDGEREGNKKRYMVRDTADSSGR